MKIKIACLSLLVIATSALAQKKELKEAEKLINQQKFNEARTELTKAQGAISNLKPEDQIKLFKLKGVAYTVGENISLEDYKTGIDAFNKVIEKEKATNKNKYTVDAQLGIIRITQQLEKMARTSNQNKEFDKSAKLFEYMYTLNPTDTVYLFNASASHVNAKNYDAALNSYQKLYDIGYTGKGKVYTAKNKATGEVHIMKTKEDMDALVAKGEYTDPQTKDEISKRGEITMNMALIYLTQGKDDKAIEAFQIAKKENPDDTSISEMEATMYYTRGVEFSQAKDFDNALKNYKKTLEIDPEHPQANFNTASIYLSKDQPLVDQINTLGNTSADLKKYETLQKQRKDYYQQALPFMEKYIELAPDDKAFAKNLLIIYQTLEDPKADAFKTKYGL